MSQVVKNPPANSGIIRDTCLISESEKPFGGEHGNPLQYSYPKNPMGRGAWWAIVHRVAESQAWLKCFSMNTCIQKWICPHYQHLFRSCWGLFNYFYSTVFLVNNSTLNIHWKDWCWSSILWPPDVKSQLIGRPWCWERMRARNGGDRGGDGWMASLAQWTWKWVNSQRWWRTGKPGVLKFIESQRIRHDLATEQQLDFKTKIVETTVLKFHYICLHAVWLSPYTHFPFLFSWKSSKV